MVQKAYNADKSKAPTPNLKTLLKYGLQPSAEWPEDSELFLDFIYWSRQLLALVMGIIWGIIPLTGIFGIAL